MPFTPFHFGPGFLVKSILRDRFHFGVFIWSQIIIDLEVLWNIYWGSERLHTFFHTYAGAVVAGMICLVTSIVFNEAAFRYFNQQLSSLKTLTTSTAIGVGSHVFLDSLMHADMTPLAPISDTNIMLYAMSVTNLHLFCLGSWGAAALVYLITAIGKRFTLYR